MKTKDIEPGGYYMAIGGNIREIISIHNHISTWRWAYLDPRVAMANKLRHEAKHGKIYTSQTCTFSNRLVSEVEPFEGGWREVK